MSKILIIGPFPSPVTGMAFSNQTIYNGLINDGFWVKKINFNETKYTKNKTLNIKHGKVSFYKILNALNYLESYKIFFVDTVYITIGLTFFGLLKYAPFILIAKCLNKKVVFHSHGNYLHVTYAELKGFKKKVFKKILNAFDQGIVLSEILKENLTSFYPESKLNIVYNFVENQQLEYYKKNANTKAYDSIKLLYMSNIIPSKGIYELIEVLNELIKDGIVIKTTIAGELPLLETTKFNTLISSNEHINYEGVIHGSKKWEIINNHNTFCLPTYFPMEGQPISILENMAAGSLILTTKHAGIPDICDENNAVFIQKKSRNSLYIQLKKLSLNSNKIKEKGTFNFNNSHQIYAENLFLENIKHILI